ncbi:ScbA/BarX family gamma-butyrolactone biosynthesis protein [Streptomyces sp. TRM 70351]|uniref:ScbA/BarX family gamma-butyrolactone biosynthesis protein n=1 Tax=Streptomyces sp. TRM 70351 TaxID=3116552 RepID=UPI002E7C2509|nr:ScbA/BarX family gamma-butyrolactone biosynthesis protein [Streptomyces sp. TRM 70351]MEE1930421.1 ScbA/BarX family gamma-butyrolactone biosynthesis protein [Streptomyces sp. TRM 70351]
MSTTERVSTSSTGLISEAFGDEEGAAGQEHLVRPVPKELVHCWNARHVLPTAASREGDHLFSVAVRWPHSHQLYGPGTAAWCDPQLVGETLRQSGILLAHVGYGLPLGHQLLLQRMTYEVDELALLPVVGGTRLTLRASFHDVVQRGGVLRSASVTVTLHRGGVQVGTGAFDMQCVPPTVYARLRAAARKSDSPSLPVLPAAVPPAAVGRVQARDVMLAPGAPHTWVLRVERDHPVVYDHPLDHVSGMALMEAMCQAARLAVAMPSAAVPAMDATFVGYVEHDEPCLVTVGDAERIDADGFVVPVRVYQRGHEAARCRFSLRGPAA